MPKKLLVLSLLLSLFLAGGAQAAELVAPNRDSGNVLIPASENRRNLYTAGSNVTINGTVSGDLTAAGGMINLVGSVEQDAMVAGGTLDLSGSIGGDARIAGGNITLSGPVSGDVVVAGGNVNINNRSSVGGDLLAASGNLTVNGPVTGNLRATGGNITINSRVAGNVYVRSTQQLTFGPDAEVLGQIVHKGPAQAKVEQGAKVGNIQFEEVRGAQNNRQGARSLATAGFFIQMLALIAAGLILLRFAYRFTSRAVASVFGSPWESLGIGLLFLIVTPIAAILLLFTFIGYYIAFLAFLVYLLLIAVSLIVATMAIGRFIYRYINRQDSEAVNWKSLVIGVIVWALLGIIPVVGWVIMFIIFLMAFGAAVRQFWANKSQRAA